MSDEEMSYAAVRCRGDSIPGHCCGVVEIDAQEYMRQMSRADSLWCCPNCGSTADFDDAYFEKSHGIDQDDDGPPPHESDEYRQFLADENDALEDKARG